MASGSLMQSTAWVDQDRQFRLRPSAILHLHRVALDGINSYAGNYRPAGVEIEGSEHAPPGAHLVPELIEELCDYVNENWDSETAIHLSAYVMWRLNWIHPFSDGNGRTARAVSYVILSVRLGERLPGTNTIPEQVSTDKQPYYRALEAADNVLKQKDRVDVSSLEKLLGTYLASQLYSVLQKAKGEG